MKPIVSIVMPVFNAEKTLERVVKSFQAQTLADWELIAVNDGSTDRSLDVLCQLAANDDRIVVIDKPNGGVASARQAGIDRVSGKYSIHADSDDWVEPEMLERMVAKAEATDADLVIADYFIDIDRQEPRIVRQKPDSLDSKDVLYAIYDKKLFGGLCHKLLRTALYEKASAKFIPGIDFCEDVLLLTQILAKLDLNIVYIPEAFYHYVMTDSSLTRNITRKGFDRMLRFNAAFPVMLPDEPRFNDFACKSELDTFIMGFVNRVFPNREIKQEFAKVKQYAYRSFGLRWRIGFFFIQLGAYGIARKFIKF
ncbi:MAG: glycosyltransferase [Bacteroides sp.]|nr:glycosyltransferase [Alistipes timonensis]MCM1311163.1 glycosyltransferase [Bacteroides sp.]MCM1405580.1 glycosyltransferase [[Clostridium] fimetarium]